MSVLTSLLEPVRAALVERAGSLRPAIPPVAVEAGPHDLVLARVRRARRRMTLEALEVRSLVPPPSDAAPAAGEPPALFDLPSAARDAFGASQIKPGKTTLVLPDSLARISILTLPERPKSLRQLAEMLRFKLRRSVPFRLEDAVIAHQLLPDSGVEPMVLVAVMQRSVLDPYEKALTGIGARPGIVGLATVQLFNLYREALAKESETSDAALLNCTQGYFSLLLVRRGRLIFFRCKTYAGHEGLEGATETMNRELASSLSYYEEKLGGAGIGTAFLRTVAQPVEDVSAILERLGVGRVEPVNLERFVVLPDGKRLDPQAMHRVAPAVAAAVGGW